MKVHVDEAAAQLPELVQRACAGEEVVIAGDTGEVHLHSAPCGEADEVRQEDAPAQAPESAPPAKRKLGVLREPGTLRGKIWIAPDFDDPLPKEVLDSFYNFKIFPDEEGTA